MASKKRAAPAASYVRCTAALMHGDTAEGARYVNPGFAFTPDDDLAFALGFPHFRYLTDGHPDDEDAAATAKGLITGITGLNGRLELPRQVATRLARALPLAAALQWTPAMDQAVAVEGPISLDEAKSLITELMARPAVDLSPHVFVWILEGLHGPEPVAEFVIESMEAMDEPPRFRDFLVHQLGFLFLRARPDVAVALRARVAAVFERWAAASKLPLPLPVAEKNAPNFDWTVRVLDVMLHGAAGATRSLLPIVGGLDLRGVAHVLDDSVFVLKMVQQEVKPPKSSRDYPDARLAFLGGLGVVDHYAPRVPNLNSAGERKRIIDTFGRIKAPTVVTMIVSLLRTSKAKKEATAWLLAHGEYARPVLEELARGKTEDAALASAVLSELR
jgi:hypothetical protein